MTCFFHCKCCFLCDGFCVANTDVATADIDTAGVEITQVLILMMLL